MKPALTLLAAVLLAVAVVAWIVFSFTAPEEVAASGTREWPGGMGTLESVSERYPPLAANDASAKLAALARGLPPNEAVESFVAREIAHGGLAIGGAPPLPDVSAIRELLLREEVAWGRRGGVVGVGDSELSALRGALMTVARALVASALAKAAAADPAAWDDLRAAWNLARSLESRPEMMAQTAALSMARMVNAVAWKMPLPPPPWLAELQARDSVKPLLEAFQYQTASYWDTARAVPTKWSAAGVEHDRGIAVALFGERRCEVSAAVNRHGSDLTSVWRRAFRFRAEREATANALRVRQGEPVEEASVCSDGAWTFDGTTLRFSRPIPTAPPDTPMPLELRVGAGG